MQFFDVIRLVGMKLLCNFHPLLILTTKKEDHTLTRLRGGGGLGAYEKAPVRIASANALRLPSRFYVTRVLGQIVRQISLPSSPIHTELGFFCAGVLQCSCVLTTIHG